MGRRIIWSAYESSESAENVDGYSDKLLKYIPADVVSFWLAGNGLVQSQAGEARGGVLWLLFVIGFVLTALWTRKLTSEPGRATAWQQIILSCVSFFVWVFAIGGPFSELPFYDPFWSSFLLLVYTAAVPLLPTPPLAQQ